jgi:hypothetical protein
MGKLQFKEYAKRKPLSVAPDGRFLTTTELAASPELRLGSLHTLSSELQVKLAIERYAMEPDFKLGIIGLGVLTRDEVITHMKNHTDFGQLAVRVEMGYCNNLIAALPGAEIPAWPKPPKPATPKEPYLKAVKPVTKSVQAKVLNQAIFCENTTDPVTTPIANQRIATVHPVFQSRGFSVVALKGTSDVRTHFVPQAKKTSTVYLSGVGHGSYTVYTGHWSDPILEVGKYDPSEVSGKAIHFLSCQTAAQLGPDTVAKGATCYAGFIENFTFVWDDSSTPANEFLLFVNADATFDIMMANGATAQQSFDATVQAFNSAIAQVPGTVAASWLTYDRDLLRLVGAPGATLRPYRLAKVSFPILAAEKHEALQDALIAAGELID